MVCLARIDIFWKKMSSMKGKVTLVTGASSGIGAAIAERLVKEGCTVVGCARRLDRLKDLSDKWSECAGSFDPVICDARKEKDILAVFEHIKQKHGKLDICVNNAGLCIKAAMIDGATEAWREMFDVNVMAVNICTREALRMFDQTTGGHIVNIGSIAGHVTNVSAARHYYCATKWMVKVMTECLRRELREKGSRTRVTMISPGVTGTEILEKEESVEISDAFFSKTEHLEADQIADATYFCLSAAANMEVNDIIVRPTSQKV